MRLLLSLLVLGGIGTHALESGVTLGSGHKLETRRWAVLDLEGNAVRLVTKVNVEAGLDRGNEPVVTSERSEPGKGIALLDKSCRIDDGAEAFVGKDSLLTSTKLLSLLAGAAMLVALISVVSFLTHLSFSFSESTSPHKEL